MTRIELTHMEGFMCGQARAVLADVKAADFADPMAVAGLLGRAKVAVENLLEILGETEGREIR